MGGDGNRFAKGEYFLSELIIAVIMKTPWLIEPKLVGLEQSIKVIL